jgi:Baseplate J-like protein
VSFQIKDFASIVASQVNHARATTTKITDFLPGSVARTIMEAPAVEIEELYLQMFLGLRDAIPVATFLSFGFDELPARVARGFVSVSTAPAPAADIAIPAGTVFSTEDDRVYTSTEAVTWATGQLVVRVPVAASVAGLAGNAAAGAITSSPSFGDGFTVSNALIANGADAENDAEREARFAEFVASLSSGTEVAVIFAARRAMVLDADGNIFESVVRVGYTEEPGIVRLYLYSTAGLPSSEILATAQRIIDGERNDDVGLLVAGYRSAGVRLDVLPMVERAVPLSVQVEMLPGFDLTSSVIQDLGDAFGTAVRAVSPGSTLLLGSLLEQMLETSGVRSLNPVTTSNIVCAPNEALIPGVLTATPAP